MPTLIYTFKPTFGLWALLKLKNTKPQVLLVTLYPCVLPRLLVVPHGNGNGSQIVYSTVTSFSYFQWMVENLYSTHNYF